MRQKQAYINQIVDHDGITIALKFGIANEWNTRLKNQSYLCKYDIRNYAVFYFNTIESCKKAERACKESLICGIITKEEMPDGYTETTDVNNLDLIIEIYARNGGVEII